MMRTIEWPVHSRSVLRSRRSRVTALLVVVLLVASIVLYDRPAHILPVGPDQRAWLQAVDAVSREGSGALNTCLRGVAGASNIPGLGPISSICTWGVYHDQPLKIRFLSRGGVGLLYMTHQVRDWTLQVGYCSSPLGGPWYQLAPSSRRDVSCPRGFSPVPTP